MQKCTKEKQIEKIEAMAEKSNDCIISMQSDIGYIKTAVDKIQTNHLANLDEKVEHLANNYIVFKTKMVVYVAIGTVVFSAVTNIIISKLLNEFLK